MEDEPEYTQDSVENAVKSQRWLYDRIERVASLLGSPWDVTNRISFESDYVELTWTEYRCRCCSGEEKHLSIPYERLWDAGADSSDEDRNRREQEAKEKEKKEAIFKRKEDELRAAEWNLNTSQQTLLQAPSQIERLRKELEALRSSS